MPLKRPLHLPSLLLTLTFTLTSACLFTQTETPDQDMGSGNNTTPPVNNTTPVNNTSPNNSTTPAQSNGGRGPLCSRVGRKNSPMTIAAAQIGSVTKKT